MLVWVLKNIETHQPWWTHSVPDTAFHQVSTPTLPLESLNVPMAPGTLWPSRHTPRHLRRYFWGDALSPQMLGPGYNAALHAAFQTTGESQPSPEWRPLAHCPSSCWTTEQVELALSLSYLTRLLYEFVHFGWVGRDNSLLLSWFFVFPCLCWSAFAEYLIYNNTYSRIGQWAAFVSGS